MKNKSIEILALTILCSLLATTKIVPVKAAPSSDGAKSKSKPLKDTKLLENTPLFESTKFRIAFITTLSMTGLAILIGTGKSIKYYNFQQEEQEQEPEESKIEIDQKAVLNENNTKENDDRVNGAGNKELESQTETPEQQVEQLVKQETSPNSYQQWPLDDPKADYRRVYQNLQQQVYQSPDFANNPTWEVDTWEVDVEIAIMILSKSPNNFEQVKKVLLESDRVREWKQSLPQEEFKTKTSEYIEKANNWAQDLQKWRTSQSSERELSSK